MAATGAGTRVGVTLRLPQLQNLCKRDPEGYRDDYNAQIRRLGSEVAILGLGQPPSASLVELLQFAAAVASSSYKGEESNKIANLLMNLLVGNPLHETPQSSSSSGTKATQATTEAAIQNLSQLPASALHLHRDIRKTCVSALILMRNKGAIEPLQILEPFFRIMATIPDKGLRTQLYKHIVNDIRNLNKKGKRDEKVNRSIQSFLHRVVSVHGVAAAATEDAATDVAARRATDMVCELYRRHVWTDDRAVAIVASAVQSPNLQVACRAMRFFLGIEEKMAADSKKEQEQDWNEANIINYHHFSKKTKAHSRHVERQLKNRKKVQRKKQDEEWTDITPEQDKGVEACKKLYPAIEMLRDPQGLAEAVFKRLKTSSSFIKYDVKLLMINFVTRLVGNHELLLLPLYSFLQKYMGGQQRDVTAILAYTVQACHPYVPPDEIYGILKTIAHNFITERCTEEQMAVGINAVRAICARVPAAMSVEESQASQGSATMDIEAFARDIAAFGNHRDRSVSIAGKAWTNFVRETNPGLLQGKDRGMAGTALLKSGAKPLRYGERKVAAGVEGADLLAAYEAKKAVRRDGAPEDDGSSSESEDDDGWEEAELDGPDGEAAVESANEDNQSEDESDEEAPILVNLDKEGASLDISKMTPAEREKLKQQVSANRIFTPEDFERMRKLVERENRAKRDPREKARRKRAEARGIDYDALSDDEEEDEPIRITGAVNPEDIMAMAKKKRQTKAEKLESILAGRTKFEAKRRDGGATNVEKKRTKNFQMAKHSAEAKSKGRGKGSISKKRKQVKKQLTHDAKKRRRKL